MNRSLPLLSLFSLSFKSASDWFTTPPTGSDARVIACYDNLCYDKFFKSPIKSYESDYILCDLYSSTIDKVSDTFRHLIMIFVIKLYAVSI